MKGISMRVSYFCFIAAVCAALMGMSLGIVMGIRQDFSLAPAHAHLNLLGWVTMALFGLYHRGIERPSERLAWVQAVSGTVGFVLMAGGLAIYLGLGVESAVGSVIAGSMLCLLSMLLFLVIVVGDLARTAKDRRNQALSRPAPGLA
ncbi:MAG: hypothetical protein AB7P20_24110 [Rhizobiaceae bacterium]